MAREDPPPDPSGGILRVLGIELTEVRIVVPFNSVFEPGSPEYEARLAELSRHHLSEMKRRRAADERARKQGPVAPGARAKKGTSLPGWLRTCRCAGCRRYLLAESDEYLRGTFADQPEGAGGNVRYHPRTWWEIVRRLPPPVAGRPDDRPYCAACLEHRGENE